MRKLILIALLLAGCSNVVETLTEVIPTYTPTLTQTNESTATLIPTSIPTETATATPSPSPTITSTSTQTIEPTPTPISTHIGPTAIPATPLGGEPQFPRKIKSFEEYLPDSNYQIRHCNWPIANNTMCPPTGKTVQAHFPIYVFCMAEYGNSADLVPDEVWGGIDENCLWSNDTEWFLMKSGGVWKASPVSGPNGN